MRSAFDVPVGVQTAFFVINVVTISSVVFTLGRKVRAVVPWGARFATRLDADRGRGPRGKARRRG